MVRRITVCAGVVLACAVSQGFGAGVTFSDRAAFEAAVGNVRRYNFETSSGFPLAPAACGGRARLARRDRSGRLEQRNAGLPAVNADQYLLLQLLFSPLENLCRAVCWAAALRNERPALFGRSDPSLDVDRLQETDGH